MKAKSSELTELFVWRADKKASEAIDKVERSAGEEAIAAAVKAVLEYARTADDFTSDDVRSQYGDFGFHEPRAWGAVMRRAARTGEIYATDRTRKTGRLSSHNRPMRIWEKAR